MTNVVARLDWVEDVDWADATAGSGAGGDASTRAAPPAAAAEAAAARRRDKLPAVLVSAHVDSAPGSSGGSDDGAGVAVMLELARSLAMGPPLLGPIVLLFNGAEESNQQAAHGFITQHRWSRDWRSYYGVEKS